MIQLIYTEPHGSPCAESFRCEVRRTTSKKERSKKHDSARRLVGESMY